MIEGTRCVLLPFRNEFAKELARAANNPNVACNLLDHFPQPYTLQDAQAWVLMCQHYDNGRRFCICVEREAEEGAEEEAEEGQEAGTCLVGRRRSQWLPVGCIEAMKVQRGGGENVAHRAELGYWLAESHWGRGIMTDAVTAFIGYLFSDDFAQRWNDGQVIIRLEASVFARNGASGRVLEKAGFELESTIKSAYVKQGSTSTASRTPWCASCHH